MPILKNQQWEIFCQCLVKGMTGDAAYTAAGYKPNAKNAARLKCHEVIKARVAELSEIVQERFEKSVVITRQWVIDGLVDIAEKASGRRPVKIGVVGKEKETLIFEPHAANTAYRNAGLELGMFTERRDVKITNEYANLTDAQLAQRLVEVGRQMLALEGPETIEHGESEDDLD